MELYLLGIFLVIFTSALTQGDMKEEYDFIIVGAGSAGATLASRLSEIGKWSILLLEAGERPSNKSDIPLLAPLLQLTKEDWQYRTEPQPVACRGTMEHKCYYPRGKVLGGSSVLNFMAYVRGNKRDYDEWEESGAKGWSYNDVLSYFKKSEGNTILNLDSEYHSDDGELTISHPPYQTKLLNAYMESANLMGLKTIDSNGPSQIGFSVVPATIRNGFRCSTEKAFLRSAYKRPNLEVVTGAFVRKIEISDKKADGVHFKMDGVVKYAKAKMEVIVSAGTINSPQILMLSGLGPKKHLEDLGISVVEDLPVGKNLQDHVGSAGLHYMIDSSDALLLSPEIPENEKPGAGPLTIPASVEAVAYLKTKYETKKDDYPDIQIFFLSSLLKYPFYNEKVTEYLSSYKENNIFTLLPILLHPKSIGNITLQSTDPEDPPLINIPYFTHDLDIKTFIEGMKFAKSIAESQPLQRFGAKLLKGPIPGCEKIDEETDEYLECVAKSLTSTIYHPIGTCKMGDIIELDTVVDPELRVKNIGKLRVVDASVMPSIPSGNTNAPSIMIAEKAADLIKNYYM